MSKTEAYDFDQKYKIISSGMKPAEKIFYYAVKTTGIFCRPGCSSRLPKPKNVIFFDTPQEAIRAGFRPCKRCKPLSDGSDAHTSLIIQICRIIEESEEIPRLKSLSEKTGYSASYIQRLFKKLTGISPHEYSTAIKSARFRNDLDRDSTITSSIYEAGFGSASRVYENTSTILGMSPGQYKNFGEGVELRVGVFSCSLGFVLIAVTERGIASVKLGDKEAELRTDLEKRFCNAIISSLSRNDKHVVEMVLKKIENPRNSIDVPLDIQGTLFQCKVWRALQKIPEGTTRTYSEIAEAIGSPKSVRAVANACGRNEIAVLIPCHRVIRKNGGIGGYRWGVSRKISLLKKEEETPQ